MARAATQFAQWGEGEWLEALEGQDLGGVEEQEVVRELEARAQAWSADPEDQHMEWSVFSSKATGSVGK